MKIETTHHFGEHQPGDHCVFECPDLVSLWRSVGDVEEDEILVDVESNFRESNGPGL